MPGPKGKCISIDGRVAVSIYFHVPLDVYNLLKILCGIFYDEILERFQMVCGIKMSTSIDQGEVLGE